MRLLDTLYFGIGLHKLVRPKSRPMARWRRTYAKYGPSRFDWLLVVFLWLIVVGLVVHLAVFLHGLIVR